MAEARVMRLSVEKKSLQSMYDLDIHSRSSKMLLLNGYGISLPVTLRTPSFLTMNLKLQAILIYA